MVRRVVAALPFDDFLVSPSNNELNIVFAAKYESASTALIKFSLYKWYSHLIRLTQGHESLWHHIRRLALAAIGYADARLFF